MTCPYACMAIWSFFDLAFADRPCVSRLNSNLCNILFSGFLWSESSAGASPPLPSPVLRPSFLSPLSSDKLCRQSRDNPLSTWATNFSRRKSLLKFPGGFLKFEISIWAVPWTIFTSLRYYSTCHLQWFYNLRHLYFQSAHFRKLIVVKEVCSEPLSPSNKETLESEWYIFAFACILLLIVMIRNQS